MSSQDRLLSDEELLDNIDVLLTKFIEYKSQYAIPGNAGYPQSLLELFNTQKRLYAESVMASDAKEMLKWNDVAIRNELHKISRRAEQRARIK